MFKDVPILQLFWNNTWIWWLMIASAVMFVAGLAALPIVAVRIPEDYFLEEKPPLPLKRRHPLLEALIWLARNLIGVILIGAGVIMLFTPGQGLLSIVVGLMLVTFPGKKWLIRKIVERPTVLNPLNAMRAKFGRPPLRMKPPADDLAEAGDRGKP